MSNKEHGIRERMRRLFQVPGDPCQHTTTWPCGRGEVRFCFSSDAAELDLNGRSSESLPELTNMIQIIVQFTDKSESRISARFSAKECVELLDGQWPNDQ